MSSWKKSRNVLPSQQIKNVFLAFTKSYLQLFLQLPFS